MKEWMLVAVIGIVCGGGFLAGMIAMFESIERETREAIDRMKWESENE